MPILLDLLLTNPGPPERYARSLRNYTDDLDGERQSPLCYHVLHGHEREHPDRVGVRELHENLSVYLQRVKEGEMLEETERGLPVAELRPRSAAPLSRIDQMIADGRITPAKTRPRHPDPPPPPDPTAPTLSEILQQMRDEDPR